MTTLTSSDTITIPCETCGGDGIDGSHNAALYYAERGHVSNCPTCDGDGTRTLHITVVKGERCHTHWDDGYERCCGCGRRYHSEHVTAESDTHLPAPVQALTEPCRKCDLIRQGLPNFNCPDCHDGKPTADIRQPTYCGTGHFQGYKRLGRGVIEHVLPVYDDRNTHPLPYIWLDNGRAWMVSDWQEPTVLDISVAPGDWALLARIIKEKI